MYKRQIVSPTYDGVCSDVRRIAGICHRYGVPLIVDQAHGAHFPFSKYFPEDAVSAGADVVIHSVHKTLPAMTQTALLHLSLIHILHVIVRHSALTGRQRPASAFGLRCFTKMCIRDSLRKVPRQSSNIFWQPASPNALRNFLKKSIFLTVKSYIM